ncbi:MAG: hypothetical protein WAV09_03105 [Minisyncoccia bacterium]
MITYIAITAACGIALGVAWGYFMRGEHEKMDANRRAELYLRGLHGDKPDFKFVLSESDAFRAHFFDMWAEEQSRLPRAMQNGDAYRSLAVPVVEFPKKISDAFDALKVKIE